MSFSMQEKATISLEVENLLKKGSMEQVFPEKDQFLSNIFIKKEGWRQRLVINLKELLPIHSFSTHSQKKEVHMKTETQGCRFMFSSFSGRPKKSDVSVRKILVPNSMPVFWTLHQTHMFRHNSSKFPSPFKKGNITRK